MVNREDTVVHSGPIQPEDYTVVFIRESDEVVVVNAHPPVLQVVRASLGNLIEEEESMSRMAVTFLLDQRYFYSSIFGESGESHIIIRCLGEMIQGLQDLGWMLLISADLGQVQSRSALFFRRIVSQQQLNTGPFACITPSLSDK